MTKRVLSCIAAAALALSGCANQPEAEPKSVQDSIKTPDCRTSNGRCLVTVSVKQGMPCTNPRNIIVDPEELVMAGKQNRVIVWDLKGNYEFCTGDGVSFKNPDNDGQFFDNFATDDPNGNPSAGTPGRCKSKYRWQNKNSPTTAGNKYPYLILFTGHEGRCILDPFIRNG